MHIQSISSVSYNTLPAKNKQNFRGLWGGINEIYPDWGVLKVHDYFPFADETKEEIQKKLSSQASSESLLPYGWEGPTVYIDNEAKVKQVLPFTLSEWTQYINGKYLNNSNEKVFIESTLKHFGLKSYIKI